MIKKNKWYKFFQSWYIIIALLEVLNILCLGYMLVNNRVASLLAVFVLLNLIGLTIVLVLSIYRFFIPSLSLEKIMNNLFSAELTEEMGTKVTFSSFDDLEQFVLMIKKIRDSLTKEYSKEALKKQAKLDALQSQINPHFLYNTLEAVRSQVLLGGLDDTADMIESLSNFFRYSISGKSDIISFETELKNLDNYIKIMQYRFVNRFSIVTRIDYNDDILMNFLLPKLLLQPIIENAMKHGLEPKVGTGVVVIRAVRSEKVVEIFIEDDGIGMDSQMTNYINAKLENRDTEDDTPEEIGIALLNVNERIRMFYGDKYGLSLISSKGYGTTVRVKLPSEM